MTSAAAPAAAPPAAPPADGGGGGDGQRPPAFNWVDGLGIAAAVALVAITIDILSDGRFISRRLRGRKGAPADEPASDG